MVHYIKITLLAVCVLAVSQVTSKPRPNKAMHWNSIDSDLNSCANDIKVQELCQRCAKVTKSDIAYPMCCDNEDDAFVWCHKYLNFGLHEK